MGRYRAGAAAWSPQGASLRGEGGRSPVAAGDESRLRLLCSGFAGTGCARRPVSARARGGRGKTFPRMSANRQSIYQIIIAPNEDKSNELGVL